LPVLKSRELKSFLATPDFSAAAILVYGPDPGLVAERGKALVSKAGDVNDPFLVARLADDDITADRERLADEAHTMTLAGGQRVVWVRPAETAFAQALERYLKAPNPDAVIIAQAGNLRPSSKLRKLFETGANLIAVPCYEDDRTSLAQLIDNLVKAHRLTITDDARLLLLSRLGADRAISRSEVEKLCLYVNGKKTIEASDIDAVCGDVSALTLERLADAVGQGLIDDSQQLYAAALVSGLTAHQVQAALQRHFTQLHALYAMGGGRDRGNLARLRPPVYFKRKQTVAAQSDLWPERDLRQAIGLLSRLELSMRQQKAAPELLVGRGLLSLATRAARLKARI
jgi:DNA polymerase-3 subunit delta